MDKAERYQENFRLAKLAQAGDEEALNKLCDDLYPFMFTIYSELPYKKVIDENEIASLGRDAVNKSLKSFDPEKSDNYAAYCVWHIRNSFKNAMFERDMIIKVPHVTRIKRAKCFRTKEKLTEQNKRCPTFEEIADHLDLSVTTVKNAMLSPSHNSIDHLHREVDENHSHLEDLIADDDAENPRDLAELNLQIEYLYNVIEKTLNEREKELLLQKYGVGHKESSNLRKLGAEHGLSMERVRQIIKRAKQKIKRAIKQDGEI